MHDIEMGTAGTTATGGGRGMTPRANDDRNNGEGGGGGMTMDVDDVDDEDEEVEDTILASIFVAKEIVQQQSSKIPKPAFLHFSTAKRGEIKKANPDAPFGELSKLIGAAWKELSDDDKVKWEEKAKEDKARYAKKMSNYSTASSEDNGPPTVELDNDSMTTNKAAATVATNVREGGGGVTYQGPSCRCVLFSINPSSDVNTFVNDDDDDDWTVDSNDDPIRRSSSKRQIASAIIGEEAVVDSNGNSSNDGGGGEYLYTACNGGSLRCINTALAVKSLLSTNLHQQLENDDKNNDDVKDDNTSTNNTIVWSIENAHPVGINKIYQLPNCSPIGPVLVTGDDSGTVRLWDVRQCSSSTITNAGDDTSTIDDMDSSSSNNNNNNNNSSSSKKKRSNKKMKKNTKQQQQQKQKQENNNPFDKLMELPIGCIQSWKVNKDYISDFTCTPDGAILFATSGDGTLSVFNISYVATQQRRSSSSKSNNDRNRCNIVNAFDNDDDDDESSKKNTTTSTWDTMGYSKSDNIEDELLSCVLLKKSKKLCVGTQDGTLCLYTYGQWADMSDRFPGHPQSIDAILKIDEDTILTGSSDGLIRAVQLLPNSLLGVLGGHDHDGFPVEGLGWSAGRRLVGSISHDEYIHLWDASLLNDDDIDDIDIDDGNNDGNNVQEEKESTKTKAAAGDDSDDWDDMDEDDNSDDDDNNDSDDDDDNNSNDGTGSDKPKKREKIFKTDNESFFSDL